MVGLTTVNCGGVALAVAGAPRPRPGVPSLLSTRSPPDYACSMSPAPRWTRWISRHPSALLLLAQTVALMLYPLVDDDASERVLFSAGALVVVPLALWVATRGAAANWFAWLLAIPAIALSAIAIVFDQPDLVTWSALLESLLYFYAAGGLIVYMFQDRRVTPDELFAVGATFTLLAWGFAYAYYVCSALLPLSFTGPVEPDRTRRWIELLYLSFSTLSGVGNSDIMPVAAQARVLVMLEQFAGVGFIAIVVSRMIGLWVVRRGD